MTDGFESPDERLEKPIDTDMPHSTSDVRELASVVGDLADAIDDAIGLINGAHQDTEDGGWDDDGADRFRASLMVGRGNASDLEADVRTYAQKLEDYADALSAADERLHRARDVARAADLLDGTIIHPPDVGVYVGERMAPPDQQEPGYEQRQATEDAYYSARAEFAAAVAALQDDGIPAFAKDVVKQTYFGTADFIRGEIADVARWYNQGNIRPLLLFDLGPSPRLPHHLLPDLPDDLVLRAVKSYGGATINVFGIAFDIYTGTPVEEAIFIGIGGALGGAIMSGGLTLALGGPPAWASVAAAGFGSVVGSAIFRTVWRDSVPEDVKDWFEDQRQEIRDTNKTREDGILWNEYYDEERDGKGPYPQDIDLKGP